MPNNTDETVKILLNKLGSEEGSIDEAEDWVIQLKQLIPWWDSSGECLQIEANVKARRKFEELSQQYKYPASREQLIDILNRIETRGVSAEEIDALVKIFVKNVPHPAGSNLIFYPPHVMTNEETVDFALAYKPILL